jgi:tRNA-dihydrouridine synthase B
VMVARGALGNPWIFGQLTGRRSGPPSDAEIVGELISTMDHAAEHFGPERANRWLRKLYPWYMERLGVTGAAADSLQRTATLEAAKELLDGLCEPLAVAA